MRNGLTFALCIILSIVCFAIGHHKGISGIVEPPKPKVDTLLIRDTITLSKPIFLDRKVIDSVLVPVNDTIRIQDTLFVYLEREQLRWEDSLSVVYASGINPQVDSVVHYLHERVITREIPMIVEKRTRWGIGFNAGYGIGKEGLSPWVGVGLSYNLIGW